MYTVSLIYLERGLYLENKLLSFPLMCETIDFSHQHMKSLKEVLVRTGPTNKENRYSCKSRNYIFYFTLCRLILIYIHKYI